MMKPRFVLAAAALAVMTSQVGIQAADPIKVAVIDRQAVLEKTKSGKRAMDSMKEFAKSRERILAADEQELRGLEKELQEHASGLSDAAKRDKQEQLGAKFQTYQRRRQEFEREIQAKQKDLGDDYEKKIKDVAGEIAQKEGYSAIVDKGNDTSMKIVIYHQPAIDLTDQVAKEFDKRFP